MKIKQIESIGLVPDGFLHEPVSAQPVDDEKMKGKIVDWVWKRIYLWWLDKLRKVITTSKVVIGQ
jgi:hypothetical protein